MHIPGILYIYNVIVAIFYVYNVSIYYVLLTKSL